jgi:hypothetical protein
MKSTAVQWISSRNFRCCLSSVLIRILSREIAAKS